MSAVRGFTAVPNVVVRDKSLPAATRLLYGVMLSYAWGGRACTASVETLCTDTGIGRTAFFEAVKLLRERGMLRVEKRVSPNGWRNVYVPVVELKGVTVDGDDGGEVRDPDGGSSAGADGGLSATRTQKKTKGEEDDDTDVSSSVRARADQIPDDFPEELRPHARLVLPLLREVAVQHGAREVKALALGRVIMARQRKPLVRAAHDFAAWAADPPRPIRDVVASYRRWLDNERDLQAVERLPGAPAVNGAGGGGQAKRFTRED